MRQLQHQTQNGDEVPKSQDARNAQYTPNGHTSTRSPHKRSSLSVRSIPSLPHKSISSLFQLNQRVQSHNPSRGQPALKPVDVFGPSDPRTRRRTLLLSQSPRPGSVVCARRCALPPAVSPLGRAPCSVALPSLAGLSSPSRSALDRWLLGEERARRMARQLDEYSCDSMVKRAGRING